MRKIKFRLHTENKNINKTSLKLLENTRKWRKTKKGVLTNIYSHMRERHQVSFSLKEFHTMFLNDKKFDRLYKDWLKSKCNKQLKPSIDRIDCKKAYTKNNIQMLTWAENRFKQSKLDGKRGRKPAVLQLLGNKVVKRFLSQRHTVKELDIHQGNLSSVLNGKRQTVNSYRFIYENPKLLDNNE